MPDSSISDRKADHIELCAKEDVGFHETSTLLGCVRLVHDALPDMKLSEVDTSVTLLGKRLRAPLVIAAMTGGTEQAERINHDLAIIAEERGYAFGLGSQRAMHLRPATASTYKVREVAPTALVFGNVGVVQARGMTTSEVRGLIEQTGADALCIHLNPAMELVQPGGDRDFSRGVSTIQRLVEGLRIPVIVKETGCGLSPSVARRLRAVGVRHLDVSGAGGTSWVGVETLRADAAGDTRSRDLGKSLWDWGIPTAASVALVAPLGFETVVATGGVTSGVDVAKAIALGAHAAGLARPVLKALMSGGRAAAVELLEGIEAELRAVMMLTGSRDLGMLRRVPRVVVGDLRLWIDSLTEP